MNLENLLYGSIPLPMNIKKCIARVYSRVYLYLYYLLLFISKRIFMEIFTKIRRTLNFYNSSDEDSDFWLMSHRSKEENLVL